MRFKETDSRISRFSITFEPCQIRAAFCANAKTPRGVWASSEPASPHAANEAATAADSSRSWVCLVASVASSIVPARYWQGIDASRRPAAFDDDAQHDPTVSPADDRVRATAQLRITVHPGAEDVESVTLE